MDGFYLHLSAALMFYCAQNKASEAEFGSKSSRIKPLTHPNNSRLQKRLQCLHSRSSGNSIVAFTNLLLELFLRFGQTGPWNYDIRRPGIALVKATSVSCFAISYIRFQYSP
jgi:hypothetical protein